ncbi:MAG: tRNA-(ms[2]io[6]A)-hydroxylase [Bacteroidetes bacterium]|nr:MAG: tRNA-(ms[2]io[6]A)-hydroxylase [Bacteroidota bacterium]
MLGLKLATDPRWVNIAEKTIEDILTDHAFCEQKAASSGISLIVNYSDKEDIVQAVTPLVAEEWGHFRKVVKELNKRGLKLGKQRRDEYVLKIKGLRQDGGTRDQQLVEHLLIFALIEARSCERFRLLSLHISDPALKEFYHEFMVSEAGHYRLFIDLAKKYMPEEHVKERWNAILEGEAEILASLELRGDRVH